MGAALSVVHNRQRFDKFGSDYFRHAILPLCRSLLEELGISHSHAAQIFEAFVKMDTDGSGNITVGEFHRYVGWKRGVFTERIFDVYASVKKDNGQPNKMSYEEFLICVWNYCTYDQHLMAKYVFDIFDIDGVKSLSIDELDALLRMVYVNQDDDALGAAKISLRKSAEGATVTLKSFQEIAAANKATLKPAFDIQLRIIEKTTGDTTLADGKNCWELYRERRRGKYESTLPDFECNGRRISFSCNSVNESRCELSKAFLSSLPQRVERKNSTRLEEEIFVDNLREALDEVKTDVALAKGRPTL